MKRLAILILSVLMAGDAMAIELVLTQRYALNQPSSLDYDPTFCGLWIANEGPEAILVTLDGLELRRISSDLYRIKAISLEGDSLIVGDGAGSFQRLSKDGEVLDAPFQIEGGWADTEGITVDGDGNLITVEDDPEYLTWLSPEGAILRRVNTLTLDPPLSEAQGIARDPRTGYLLIVDDFEGTNSLYEFAPDGTLLSTASLLEYGIDPEGIAIRPGSNQLFIAFDEGEAVASFDYQPTMPTDHDPLPPSSDCVMF